MGVGRDERQEPEAAQGLLSMEGCAPTCPSQPPPRTPWAAPEVTCHRPALGTHGSSAGREALSHSHLKDEGGCLPPLPTLSPPAKGSQTRALPRPRAGVTAIGRPAGPLCSCRREAGQRPWGLGDRRSLEPPRGKREPAVGTPRPAGPGQCACSPRPGPADTVAHPSQRAGWGSGEPGEAGTEPSGAPATPTRPGDPPTLGSGMTAPSTPALSPRSTQARGGGQTGAREEAGEWRRVGRGLSPSPRALWREPGLGRVREGGGPRAGHQVHGSQCNPRPS